MKIKTVFGLTKRVALLGLVLGVCMTSCGKKDQGQGQQQAAPQIGFISVTKTSTDLESVYPATIKGQKDVQIRPQVSGFITKVCVDEGQQVSAGQVLFVIDQVQYEAAVNQAKAAVSAAQQQVNSAQITANNKKKLFEKNVISDYENQLAQNDLAAAKAQLSQARAALVNAEKSLSYTVVKAPSAGFVGSIPNREGSLASPSSQQPLTTISDISEVYAYISFNERQVLEMTKNGSISLAKALSELPAAKLKLSDGSYYSELGKFSTMTGMLDNTTGSASVRVAFKNQNAMLRSGSTGSIVIPAHYDNVILIPQSATTEMQDKKFAYVVDKSGKVTARQIEVLANNDGVNFVVTGGLENGDHVVVQGVGVTVRDGVQITPVDMTGKDLSQLAAQQQK